VTGRLFSFRVTPERVDEFVTLWHDTMLPLAKSQPGWTSARLLVDRQSGKIVVVGIWASQSDAIASGVGSVHAERQRALLGDLVTAPPTIEDFEVAGEA
jgi:quinol monooxygenase YgiN